jgi:hypothetical protein
MFILNITGFSKDLLKQSYENYLSISTQIIEMNKYQYNQLYVSLYLKSQMKIFHINTQCYHCTNIFYFK